jgi:hypothetical protein
MEKELLTNIKAKHTRPFVEAFFHAKFFFGVGCIAVSL